MKLSSYNLFREVMYVEECENRNKINSKLHTNGMFVHGNKRNFNYKHESNE